MFNKRVAEALAVRGHNVTMVLMQAMDDRTENEIEVKENVKLYRVNGSIGVSRQELEEQQASIIFEDYSMFDRRVWKSMQQGMRLIEGSCRNILNNRNFLTWLQNEHFDLAFVHVYQACPIGLVRIGGIPTWIWLNRFVAMPETELFRELVDPTFPNLIDLAEECPLAILAIADRADGIIIFSFGSIAPIQKMPRTWKDAFFKAFSLFPRIHFFVRYTGNDINERSRNLQHKHLVRTALSLNMMSEGGVSPHFYSEILTSAKPARRASVKYVN
ncbi:hypothetical protein ANCCEY_12915 [Ancylostoma ceylanicum]|uniref:glucuronosyltransferase n=1 Tax=Ancylostoma ceylanicum TaxID=53326 RepID=A0A0D6LK21_9BILA|nr:hypothetical protein ANCCEY_12915 [Ancylostoma ceylanicum]